MKSLSRLIPRSSSSICHGCRRALSTTTPLQRQNPSTFNELLAVLDPSSKTKNSASQTTRDAEAEANLPRPTTSSSAAIKRVLQGSHFGQRPVAYRASQQSQNPQSTADMFAQTTRDTDAAIEAQDLSRIMTRRWESGDVYSPYDLGPREGRKWSAVHLRPSRDVFEMIGKRPETFYKNMPLLSQFVTETGRIRHSNLTGLKPKNQRRLAKTIRRAIGCGLLPSVHKHPEVIAKTLGIDKYRGRSAASYY